MYFIKLFFLRWTNPLFYWLRNQWKKSRKHVTFQNIQNQNVFSGELKEREEMLLQDFSFGDFVNSMPFGSYQMNLYLLDLFQEQVTLPKFKAIRAIDIGSKNFEYAASLYQVYNTTGKLESLAGIEIDAYRRYDDFSTRRDHAEAYIRNLSHTSYHPMNFLHYTKRANIITMFLPFVFKEPLLFWGLPLSEYQPEKLFQHAYSLLEEGGIWIITNQEEAEEKACHDILDTLGISYEKKSVFDSPFYPFKYKRYTTIVTK